MRTAWIAVLGALGCVACGSDGQVAAPIPTPSGGGGGAGGAAAPSCAEQWVDGVVAQETGITQIHGTSAFGDDRVWVAWSSPDAGSNFDNWIAGYACDGSLAVGPLEVTQTDDNELDPVLSVSGDRVLVAWTSDNGTAPNNLDIRYRIYERDGTPVTDAMDLVASRNGTPVTGNALSPSLAPIEGGWTLAGSWGHDEAMGFQAFAVDLDRDGAVQGEAQDGQLDADGGQTDVEVAVDDVGTHLVWQRDTTTSTAPAAYGTTLGAAATLLADPGARPSVAPGPWFAWDGDGDDVVVRPPGGGDVALGLAGFTVFPDLAVAEGQAALSWMEQVDGIRFRVHVARLDAAGALGPVRTLATEDAPSVYPVDLTLVDTTHAVVVYTEGSNPDFRVKAEWITLE